MDLDPESASFFWHAALCEATWDKVEHFPVLVIEDGFDFETKLPPTLIFKLNAALKTYKNDRLDAIFHKLPHRQIRIILSGEDTGLADYFPILHAAIYEEYGRKLASNRRKPAFDEAFHELAVLEHFCAKHVAKEAEIVPLHPDTKHRYHETAEAQLLDFKKADMSGVWRLFLPGLF